MNRRKDKRALITGGTSGMGLETARQFLSEGARVALTGKSPDTLESARQELGSEVLFIASDASDTLAQKGVAASKLGHAEADLQAVSASIKSQVPAGRHRTLSEIAKAGVFHAA